MTHGHLLGNASLPFSPASILSLPAAAYKAGLLLHAYTLTLIDRHMASTVGFQVL